MTQPNRDPVITGTLYCESNVSIFGIAGGILTIKLTLRSQKWRVASFDVPTPTLFRQTIPKEVKELPWQP